MVKADTNLAASALAIALVALLTALGQLLQQYFATADGYRRCQRSVMGDWATKTRLRWRWREFRFETLFTVPDVFLFGDGAPGKDGQILIDGSDESRKMTMSSATQREVQTVPIGKRGHGPHGHRDRPGTVRNSSDELACWHPLLHWIHNTTESSTSFASVPWTQVPGLQKYSMRIPALVLRERSWDFQPPDVIRPLAKSTLSDIAVIARRMGMRWKDFRPADGILRAEGHSHIITSTMIKSLGLVLQYSYTGQGRRLDLADANLGRAMAGSVLREREELYIPRARADRFGAGVIRGEPGLRMPDITVGTQLEIVTALRTLDNSGQSASALKAIRKANSDFQFRIGDITAMTSGMVRLEGTDRVQVPAPSDNVRGFTTIRRGRRVFWLYLSRFMEGPNRPATEHSANVLEACNALVQLDNTLYSAPDTESSNAALGPTRDVKYLDAVHALFTAQNAYLEARVHGSPSFSYLGLVGSHIRLAVFRLGDQDSVGPKGEIDPETELAADYTADVEGYFKRLPSIAEELCRKKLAANPAEALDAWMSMMLRACCWGACHSFVPGERVPIEYYGSQLPVYIG